MIIKNFNLVKQKRNNTCGYATISMILNFLENQNISEDYLFENEPFDSTGITIFKVIEVYKKYLKSHTVDIISGESDEILNIVRRKLESNLPFHILYLTENLMGQKEPALHYSALIGYDEKDEIFVVADPYGSIKKINKIDFFSSISFRNECLPEFVKQKYPSNLMIKFEYL